jgi:transcriptional regulator with XRE-family HTH domain
MKDPAYLESYEAMAPEFELARELIGARSRAGLSQVEVAERMGTTQSVVARIEGGTQKPSTRTLERYARATGSIVKIALVPWGTI